MRVLLDSNAYSQLERGDLGLATLVRGARELPFSSVVAGEVLAGLRLGSRFERGRASLLAFLADPRVSVVPISLETADRYGRIYAALQKKGRPIPTNDMWIAAHTMETGAELLSFDRHFEAIDGLVWTRLER
ncbi:MAG TPA: type II toxin-antitoxin system VapC family toxin [Thermoanaerobaculia bacterium]|nr:type II toxin-antitoxin system VapC family toxin [Thermoanaerobaculia bacterium]